VVPRELTPAQRELLTRYVDAFERYDVSALSRLLHEEATLSMPPYDMWLRGIPAISRWFLNQGIGCKGSVLQMVEANGVPAIAQWRDGGRTPWAIIVLEFEGDRITSQTSYLDVETLFPRFGLPLQREPHR
jgi:RNA polymerase sigma-70 factor, ECF subfamily